MARGGTPAERARRIIEEGVGVLCCPRSEDLRGQPDYDPFPGETEEPCGVCGHPVTMVPAIREMREAGWTPVCTYDMIRFRRALRRATTTNDLERTRDELIRRFAGRHGVRAESVVQTLPPELAWLEEDLGVV